MKEFILQNYPDSEFLTADGFDDAIIGVHEAFVESPVLIYSVSKCIDILCKDMTREEAVEYFEFNVSGAYVGEQTPIWCYDDFE